MSNANEAVVSQIEIPGEKESFIQLLKLAQIEGSRRPEGELLADISNGPSGLIYKGVTLPMVQDFIDCGIFDRFKRNDLGLTEITYDAVAASLAAYIPHYLELDLKNKPIVPYTPTEEEAELAYEVINGNILGVFITGEGIDRNRNKPITRGITLENGVAKIGGLTLSELRKVGILIRDRYLGAALKLIKAQYRDSLEIYMFNSYKAKGIDVNRLEVSNEIMAGTHDQTLKIASAAGEFLSEAPYLTFQQIKEIITTENHPLPENLRKYDN